MTTKTYANVIDGTIKPINFGEQGQYSAIEYMDLPNSLPKVQLRWANMEMVELQTEQEAEGIAALGVEVRVGSDGSQYCWGIRVRGGEVVVQHQTICNFRRYGWSWTSDPGGEYGYGTGVTYANRQFFGLDCQTPEQLVRESFLVTLSMGNAPNEMKYHVEARGVWGLLLSDALRNISDHAVRACGPQTNGQCGDVKVIVPGRTHDYTWKSSVID